MKKSIVSLFVFVILTAGFQARAQVGVDNGVTGVECTENSEGSVGKINVLSWASGHGPQVKVTLNAVSGLENNLEFIAEEKSEHSFLYDVYSYELFDPAKNLIGELTISKKAPGATRGGFKNCGRAGCFDHPDLTYKGLLKIYEKEISFTCQ